MANQDHFLQTPNDILRLDKLPENRVQAEVILGQVENPIPGEYTFLISEEQCERTTLLFDRDDTSFHLRKIHNYHPDNVQVSDIQYFANEIKKCIDNEPIENIYLAGYSEGDELYDDEMMLTVEGIDGYLAIIFISIGKTMQLEINSPYKESNSGWHSHIQTYSVYSAMFIVEIISKALTGSSTISLQTQKNQNHIW